MVKPLKNHPKVHLHGLQLDLRKTHSQLKPSVFGYNLDEEDSNDSNTSANKKQGNQLHGAGLEGNHRV